MEALDGRAGICTAFRAILPYGTMWAILDTYATHALETMNAMGIVALIRTGIEIRAAARAEAALTGLPPKSAHPADKKFLTFSRAEFLAQEKEEREARSSDSRDSARDDRPYLVVGDMAILAIDGPLTKQLTSAAWLFGGTSTLEARAALRQAATDPQVKRVLLLIDSPGGQVAGTFDLADEVARVAALMPVYAYISDLCASAAYAIASQATKVFANRTAMVGCIGTYMVLQDVSTVYAQAGVKVHVVKAGAFKGAGMRGTPVTEAQLAEFQRNIDDTNDQFLLTVANGRGMDADTVLALADGRVHVGEAAKGLGLIDGVCTFDGCVALLGARPAIKGSAPKATQEVTAWVNW